MATQCRTLRRQLRRWWSWKDSNLLSLADGSAPGRERGEPAHPSVCAFSLGNLFARTLTWPHRLGGLLELELAAGPLDRGRVVAYRLHLTVQVGDGERTRVVALAETPTRLRTRLDDRLAALFA